MVTASNIIDICWIIFILYWAMNWKSVKPTKEMAWRSQGFGWIIAWILVLAYFLTPIGKNNILHQNNWIVFLIFKQPIFQILGVVLAILGLIIAITARKKLAENWSSNIEVKKDHKLITTGVYKYIRHPIYTGIACMGIGTFLVFHSLLSLLFLLVMITFCVLKLKKEEVLLMKHFPNEYPAYKKRAKALIPFIY
jgi:protein-S-isoprenylcysteine O-methyltransferase Ste14